jgi:hypothetical protein
VAGSGPEFPEPYGVRVAALPADPSCARSARVLTGDALAELGVTEESVRDAKVMISELATNALQHATGDLPHELWVGTAGREAVCAIFDSRPLEDFSGDLTFSGDCGRGLAIVAELSAGRWGVERATSRIRPEVTGKTVWFACPLPVGGLRDGFQHCGD